MRAKITSPKGEIVVEIGKGAGSARNVTLEDVARIHAVITETEAAGARAKTAVAHVSKKTAEGVAIEIGRGLKRAVVTEVMGGGVYRVKVDEGEVMARGVYRVKVDEGEVIARAAVLGDKYAVAQDVLLLFWDPTPAIVCGLAITREAGDRVTLTEAGRAAFMYDGKSYINDPDRPVTCVAIVETAGETCMAFMREDFRVDETVVVYNAKRDALVDSGRILAFADIPAVAASSLRYEIKR